MTDRPTTLMKKRLNLWVNLLLIIIAVYISVSIFRISVTESDKWRELAESQQVRSTVVPASRGTIFDSTNQVLAQSATMYNVYCDQVMLWKDYISQKDEIIENYKGLIKKSKSAKKIKEYNEVLEKTKTSEQCFQDLVAFLAQTLEMDSGDIKEKIADEQCQYVVLKREIEKSVAEKIEKYLSDEELDGIRCDPTTRRIYPQNELASNVIGHLDYDGNGIYGLEAYYDDYLAGVDGRVVTATARDGTEIPYRYKQSYESQDGNSLHLNIDVNIQYHLETALQKAVDMHKPTERACGIIMNPKTGQVYAMATNYSYNPNSPAEITDKDISAQLAKMDEESKEYAEKRLNAWSVQWKNKAISELYFPGSVFKVITGSSALEEKAISLQDTFSCNTFIQVADYKIHCWSTNDHGSQNLALSMLNSCNPAFVQIGQRLGAEKFSEYFKAYGLTEKTGIDLPSEVSSIYMPLSRMGSVELASSSFGQTNKVTPIQMITAYSAVINGGYLITPQIVDKITDSNGNVVKDFDTQVKRQVISEETSKEMREILEGVVSGQPGSNCYIKGYRIGGKSGTSQKLDTDNSETYVSSYCAFAPADDPEVIMLVMVDHPTGGDFYGSIVAAPICVEVFSDVLPYLGLFPEYTEEELEKLQIAIPNVELDSVSNATKTLEGLGLNVKVVGDGDSVVKQMPTSISVERGSSVVLYTDESYNTNTVTVPNIQGLTREQAKQILESYGLNLSVIGAGADENGAIASYDQNYAEGAIVPEGTAITVTFVEGSVGSQ
ncbi:MAG: penicillin-binding transpeptidase domain-containing protein [Ruminococcus sp.]|nr:penicillin-binding transpeptidase domain-containing protein [Ruminococcus sp.]